LDHERTQREFDEASRGDGAGWQRLSNFYRRTAPYFLPLFSTEMFSASMFGYLGRAVLRDPRDSLGLANLVRQSSRNFAANYLRSPEGRGVLESWGYHLDFGPDVSGGAVFAFVTALSAHFHGLPIAKGGAGRVTAALGAMIEEAGGTLRTGVQVNHIVVKNGQAVAVQTAAGDQIVAKRALVANVTPRNLFGSLIASEHLDRGFVRRAKRYRYGPGTYVIHLALDRLPQWIGADDLAAFNCIHINGTGADIEETYKQSLRGYLPARPLLVVSQTTQIDPSRAPPGKHVMRVHIRTVPGTIAGDAAGEIKARTWSDAKRPFTDRVLHLVERHVPGLRSAIIGMAVETPEDIERENPNFIGGDGVSGSCHIDQNYFRRPFFGWSRYRTPIKQLYMVGASTWPGGGVNAGSGYLVARTLCEQRQLEIEL
jgi:phytoene dehydrogenase-like protein